MVRSILSTVALAGLLATATPVLADSVRLQVPDQAAVSPPATEHAASPAYGQALDGDAAVRPASAKDTTPFGFGWG